MVTLHFPPSLPAILETPSRFSYHSDTYSTLALVAVSLFAILRLTHRTSAPPKAKSASMSPRRSDATPLSVLQAFFVPTRSIWPNSYREIAAKANASRACVIQLSATKLFHDFVTGEIEIRNIEVFLRVRACSRAL